MIGSSSLVLACLWACASHRGGEGSTRFPICEGVRPLGTLGDFFRVEEDLRLVLRWADGQTLTEVGRTGEVLGERQDGFVVFDGAVHHVNEYTAPSTHPSVHRDVTGMRLEAYVTDLSVTRQRAIDPDRPLVGEQPTIAMNWVLLARNHDRDSADAPENPGPVTWLGLHSPDWVGVGITIVGLRHLERLLQEHREEIERRLGPDTIPSREDFVEASFVYDVAKNRGTDLGRDALKIVLREKLRGDLDYPSARITGPRLNDKSWLMNRFDADTCEFFKPGFVAQAMVYGTPFGVIGWADLDPDESWFVVTVEDGDRGATRDDLVGLFLVSRETLRSGHRVTYRQVNTRGGVDFAVELQTVGEPR